MIIIYALLMFIICFGCENQSLQTPSALTTTTTIFIHTIQVQKKGKKKKKFSKVAKLSN